MSTIYLNCKHLISFTLTLLVIHLPIFAQQLQTNDWETELANSKGEERIARLLKLSKDLIKEDLGKAEALALEGIELAKQAGDSLSMYRIGGNLGEIYYTLNETEKGIERTQQSLRYFSQHADLAFDQSKLQLLLASINIRKRNYAKADSLISESETHFKRTDNLLWRSKIPATIGLLFIIKKEYKLALNYYEEALAIIKPLGDVETTSMYMANIGLIKFHQGLYPEALEKLLAVTSMDCSDLVKSKVYSTKGGVYRKLEDWKTAEKQFKIAIELKRKIGLDCNVSYSLYDLGVLHKRQLNFGDGLKYLEQALAIQKSCNLSVGNTLGVMGNIQYALGNPNKAIEFYDQKLNLAKAENDWEAIWNVYYNKGFYAHKAKQYPEALSNLLYSLQIAEEYDNLHCLMKSNLMLTNAYDGLEMEDSSLYYAEKYYILKDSISGFQRIKKIGALEQKYQNKLNLDSLNVSEQPTVATNQDDGFSKKFSSKLLGIGFVTLLSIIAFLFFKMNQNKKLLQGVDNKVDKSELDQYFNELYEHLVQLKQTSPSPQSDFKATDMTEFLHDKLKTPTDWEYFEHYFEKVHKDFFKSLKLKYPKISTNELNMCALLKLNIRNKDISKIMGISPESVRKAQHRLSKKIELPEDEVLRDFVLKL